MNTLFRIFAVIFILCIADVNNAYTTEGHKKDIEIVVHRGANFLAPENTIPQRIFLNIAIKTEYLSWLQYKTAMKNLIRKQSWHNRIWSILTDPNFGNVF